MAKLTTLTTEQIAAHLGVSTRTVREWVQNGCPQLSRGGGSRPALFDLDAVVTWRKSRRNTSTPGRRFAEQEEGSDGDGASQTDAFTPERRARLKLLLEKGRMAEIDRKEREGELIHREEVEQRNIERILAIKSALLGLPRSVAGTLVGLDASEIEERLVETMTGILQEFARDANEEASPNGEVATGQ